MDFNNVTDSSSYYKKYERGVRKPRGLENAAIQRNKHRDRHSEVAKNQAPKDVVEISVGKGEVQKTVTNSDPGNIPNNTTDNGNNTLTMGSDATANINSHVGTDNGDDIIVIGDGARLNMNTHVNVDNGNDTLIMGSDATANINSHVGTDNGDDVIVIGDGARLKLNSHIKVDNGNDTLIIGPDADVTINSHVGVDNGNDTLTIPAGVKAKIRLYEAAERAHMSPDTTGRKNEKDPEKNRGGDVDKIRDKDKPLAAKRNKNAPGLWKFANHIRNNIKKNTDFMLMLTLKKMSVPLIKHDDKEEILKPERAGNSKGKEGSKKIGLYL